LLVVVQDKKMARQNLRLEMKIIHSTLPTETETETETLPFEFTTLKNDTTPPFPFSPFAIRHSPVTFFHHHLSSFSSDKQRKIHNTGKIPVYIYFIRS
jgi:hypothetical protein